LEIKKLIFIVSIIEKQFNYVLFIILLKFWYFIIYLENLIIKINLDFQILLKLSIFAYINLIILSKDFISVPEETMFFSFSNKS